jgi:hypothetical protein
MAPVGGPGASASGWSAPLALSACAASGAPAVVFPSDRPFQGTGPGAVVWPAGTACPGGAGARIDAIGPNDQPGAPATPHGSSGAPIGLLGPLSAAAAPSGQIAIGGQDPHRHGQALLIQGRAGGPFANLLSGAESIPPGALTTAYLGDLALAAPTHTGHIAVRVERYFAHALGASREPSAATGVAALTVAMDFRSDAMTAWAQDGGVYVHDLPASGVRHAPQRLGPAGSHPRILALLSDDNRGLVIWTDRHGDDTDVYMDYSATGVKFGRPQVVERAADADGLPYPEGSPQLIRLSSESVMAAWAGTKDGRWVVRTAAIDQRGLREVSTIAVPSGDALLSALAPGPQGEAILLFAEPAIAASGRPDMTRQTLLATRGIDASPGRTIFGPPGLVAPAGPVSGVRLAIDPDSGRAFAAWAGSGGSIFYSIGAQRLGA